jgi:hypothetical protein
MQLGDPIVDADSVVVDQIERGSVVKVTTEKTGHGIGPDQVGQIRKQSAPSLPCALMESFLLNGPIRSSSANPYF